MAKSKNLRRNSASQESFQRYSLRKFKVGLVSVAIVAGFAVGLIKHTERVQANEEGEAQGNTEVINSELSIQNNISSSGNIDLAAEANASSDSNSEPLAEAAANNNLQLSSEGNTSASVNSGLTTANDVSNTNAQLLSANNSGPSPLIADEAS